MAGQRMRILMKWMENVPGTKPHGAGNPYRPCVVHVGEVGEEIHTPAFSFSAEIPPRFFHFSTVLHLTTCLGKETFFLPRDFLLHKQFPLLWWPMMWAVCITSHTPPHPRGWVLCGHFRVIAGWFVDVSATKLVILTWFWTRTRLNPWHLLFAGQFNSVHSVVSDSLRPHGLQHARIPCPSPTPRASSNSYPSSQWCHPTISSSVVPFSFLLRSFPVFSNESVLHIRWPKNWSFSFSISPSNEYSGLISFHQWTFLLIPHFVSCK